MIEEVDDIGKVATSVAVDVDERAGAGDSALTVSTRKLDFRQTRHRAQDGNRVGDVQASVLRRIARSL